MTTFKNMSKHEATFQVCCLKNNKQHLKCVAYKQ